MTTVTCFVDGIKSLLVRLILVIHGGLAVHFVINLNEESDWCYFLTLPLILLALDGIINIFFLMNAKCIWPVCGVLYLIVVVPVIWIQEVDEMKKSHLSNETLVNLTSVDISSLRIKGLGRVAKLIGFDMVVVQRWSDVGVFIVIIAGRWLTAIGQMSRADLTSLLIVLVAQAPDTMALRKPLIIKAATLEEDWIKTIAVMAVFTISLIEFTLKSPANLKKKTGAKKKHPKERTNSIETEKQGTSGNEHQQQQIREIKVNPKSNQSSENVSENENDDTNENDGKTREVKIHPTETEQGAEAAEVLNSLKEIGLDKIKDNAHVKKGLELSANFTKKTIGTKNFNCCTSIIEFVLRTILALCLHSGPAFILRLTTVIRYKMYDDIQLFFLVKNGVEIVVLLFECYQAFRINRTVDVNPIKTNSSLSKKENGTSSSDHKENGTSAFTTSKDSNKEGNKDMTKQGQYDNKGFNFNVEC